MRFTHLRQQVNQKIANKVVREHILQQIAQVEADDNIYMIKENKMELKKCFIWIYTKQGLEYWNFIDNLLYE